MKGYSTREAAKKLGLSHGTLANYVAAGKVPSPMSVATGTTIMHVWTEEEIEQVRKLLPKIANGRKTRYKKKKQEKKQTKPKKK